MTYAKLDKELLDCVQSRTLHPQYDDSVVSEAQRIARATGFKVSRIIEARLQVLRRSGKVQFFTKAESNGRGGWHLCTTQGEK